jgi:hypothetical protein
MGLLSFFTPTAWKAAEAEKVVWERGWPMSSPKRTLKQFWISEPIKIRPTKTPLGYTAKRVTPCVDVAFHFNAGRIVVEKAWATTSTRLNCSCTQGEAFSVVPHFFDRGVLEAILQKEADVERSQLRSCVYRLMMDEREAAALPSPSRGPSRKSGHGRETQQGKG